MEIDRQKLLVAISRVVPGIAKKELFAQADKLAFTDGHLASYNDEVAIFENLPEVEGITGAVDGRKLHELLGKVKAEILDLSVKDDKLALRAGRTEATFDLVPLALPLDQVDGSGEERDAPEGFGAALKLISGTCATDMSRPMLACVSIGGDTLEAGDGYRLAKLRFPDAALPTALLPAAACVLVSDYDVSRIAVGDGGEWMRFAAGDTTVFARLASGNYPDLSAFYAVEGTSVEMPDLSSVLDRAAIFAARSNSLDEEVDVDLREAEVAVSATCEGGTFSETLRWRNLDKVTARFKVHPDFLREALKSGTRCVVGEDKIKFIGENWEHVVSLRQ